MSAEPLFLQATTAYERGRVRWAAASALPMAVIPIASFAVGQRWLSSVALGVVLLALSTFLLWRGQSAAQGLTAGLKAGLVPLVLAHGANLYGHICTSSGCTSLCVPACALGGVMAGAIIGFTARKSRAPLQVFGWGAVTSCLVGAFGCACVGSGGIVGMVLGTAAALAATHLGAPRRA
jgi:hypothetical protein